MDHEMFETLRAALTASPANSKVLMALLRMMREAGDWAEVSPILALAQGAVAETEEERQLLADAQRRAGQHEAALQTLSDACSSAQSQLLRARVLLALDKKEEARSLYEAAVAAEPALEDLDLKAQLNARVRSISGGQRGPALRVSALAWSS